MEKIVVKGGTPLIGEVQVSGAKNAALPILAAGLLATEGTSKFYNVPKLSDIKTIILEYVLSVFRDLEMHLSNHCYFIVA